jgi:hypothetical protein
MSNRTLRVSTNGRFLQLKNGKPFFYLADTAWELLHRLTMDEIDFYFNTRQYQGFNVIQTVLISEMDGLRIPNAYGLFPLFRMDPGKPNPEYFDFVEKVMKIAAGKGLYLALVPVWGDKIDRLFGLGPEIFNERNAFDYGKWLGKRFSQAPNIIWMNGGDRSGGGGNHAVWNALGKGIKSEDSNHLMTFHPLGDASSSMWFHDAAWLDFNCCQSGHSLRNYPNHVLVTYDYLRLPCKPCIDAEPRYEEHAVNWKPEQNGVFDDYDVRQAAYWSVFAGACGHTYGAHPVWQMYDGQREPIGFVRYTWKEALNLKGASQLIYLRNLMLSRPFYERVPDQSLLLSPKVGDEHIRCTRSSDYLICYLPSGGEVAIQTDGIPWNRSRAWWYDPRTGESTLIGVFDKTECSCFKAQSSGRGSDWVLVLDDASAGYDQPGFH